MTSPPPMRFPCSGCGALLRFRPGSGSLVCDHCGGENPIPDTRDAVVELDLPEHLRRAAPERELNERRIVACAACGARTTFEAELTAAACPFCGTDVVLSGADLERQLRPQGILPFAVDRDGARRALRGWVRSRWLAPSSFKRWTRIEGHALTGVYIPHWTFDALVETDYTGSRGEYYWVTESYTTTNADGERVTRTRQVRRTSWHAASGTVRNRFDDVLVMASRSLPEEHARALEPWDLDTVVDYRPEYVSGFRAQSHQLSLEEGFQEAKQRMEGPILASVRRDIGGDEQRIDTLRSSYHESSFKYLLLPVWLGAYRYRDRPYRILVNARTGEVQGERPWSVWKITGLVVLLVAVAAAIWYATTQT